MNESLPMYCAIAVALLLMLPHSQAAAQTAADVLVEDKTRPSLWVFDRVDALDVGLIAGSAATVITARVMGPAENRWPKGGILADEAARDALLLTHRRGQHAIANVSDLTLGLVAAMPMLDATVVGWGYYKDKVLARELAIMSFEVSGVVAALQTVANSVAGRERPYGRRCSEDLPQQLDACLARERNYSFFSGHTSQTFAAAAVTCSVHAKLKLYGRGFANMVPCVAGMTLAGFTGVARIMADQHYLSDVMTGAVVGTVAGFTIPYLLRFRAKPSAVRIIPTGNGVQVGGQF